MLEVSKLTYSLKVHIRQNYKFKLRWYFCPFKFHCDPTQIHDAIQYHCNATKIYDANQSHQCLSVQVLLAAIAM